MKTKQESFSRVFNTISHYLKCICLSSLESIHVLVFSSARSMMNLYICIENRQTWKFDQQGIGGDTAVHECWLVCQVFSFKAYATATSQQTLERVPLPRSTPISSLWQTTHASGASEQEQFVENKLQLISQKQFHCDASKSLVPRPETVYDRRRKR